MVSNAKILVAFHSRSGNTLRLAAAIAEGALSVSGATVHLRRVPELKDEEALLTHPHTGNAFREIQEIPVISVQELVDYEALILGSPTAFGSMTAEMKSFVDGLGQLWYNGALQNKVGGAFTCASSPHGGHEMTLLGFLTTMMHMGMVIVTPGYTEAANHVAGTPYGATATTKPDGTNRRPPTADDLRAAWVLGQRVALITARLHSNHRALSDTPVI